MKNVVKFLSLALVAGAMLASCGTENKVTITAVPNDATMGTVTGGGEYDKDAEVTLTATPNEGFLFVKWQDDNTDNPRKVKATANATYTATFAAMPKPGLDVTFDAETWHAAGVQALDATAMIGMFLVGGQKNTQEQYPQIIMIASSTVGSHAGQFDPNQGTYGDDIMSWQYYKDATLQDAEGTMYGDWWGDQVNLNVTTYDVDNMTLSFNADGTFFNADKAYVDGVGYDATDRANFTVVATDLEMEEYTGAKAAMHFGMPMGQLTRVK